METVLNSPRGRIRSTPRIDIICRPVRHAQDRRLEMSSEYSPAVKVKSNLERTAHNINRPLSLLVSQIELEELKQTPIAIKNDWFVAGPKRLNYRKLAVNVLLVLFIGVLGYTGYNYSAIFGLQDQVLAESGLSSDYNLDNTAASLPAVAADMQSNKTEMPTPISDKTLSELMQKFGESNKGVYGVSLIEMDERNSRASYNGSKTFVTASTYKLFVAYSALKRVEAGTWHWSDHITGGRNLSTCLDDMIVKSDNACGATLLAKVGYRNITNEAKNIGCTDTSFVGKDNIVTTANDLGTFMAGLQSGKILSLQSSRDLLIGLLKRNVYRNGIPAGSQDSVVADKVGFMNGLLHDASIVYSPSGTYVLVIMTDGSSWQSIAELSGQIKDLRNSGRDKLSD